VFVCLLCLVLFDDTQETTKLTKENSTGRKHRWKRAECYHVQKSKKKTQQSRFLQAYGKENILHT
jgi:hypothetical protein